jgi:hypothetical protein
MPTEATRHRLYEKIKEQWGQENADELMSYLPPVGRADVATKQDLALLGAELRGEMVAGFASLRSEMHKGFAEHQGAMITQLRWMLGIVLTAFVGLTGVFSAIVNWLG